ncbi:MAG TPA: PorP/SprF family type IX secretion system membrane protein [Chitinophagales bacterium]|nr:PorP/SprF family type IX secretion system membrane protein [Chitinophagales bacterium]
MRALKVLSVALIIFSCGTAFPQDPEFTQFDAAPLHLNPALAGISYGPRFNLNYRNQWTSLEKGYVTYAASFDMHLDKLGGGLGVLFLGDRIANGLLSSYYISVMYAYQLKLSENFGIKLGVQGGFIRKHIDWHSLTFSDQINPLTGFEDPFGNMNPTGEQTPDNFNLNLHDFGAGFVAFSSKVYGGISVKHITQPKESFVSDEDARLPLRIDMHAGGDIDLVPHRKNTELTLSPNILLAQQSNFIQLNFGTYLYAKYIYGGVWFRHTFSNSDAVMGVVGIKYSYIRVGYSYDYTISTLQNLSGGAHEISITFNRGGGADSLNKKRRQGELDCPNFLNF